MNEATKFRKLLIFVNDSAFCSNTAQDRLF